MEYRIAVKCSNPQNIGRLGEDVEPAPPPSPAPEGVILTGHDATFYTGYRVPVLMIGKAFFSRQDLQEILTRMDEMEASGK